MNRHWDSETDVVVVGMGAAGAIAAITAHDAGRSVLILEKQAAKIPVNNSTMSGGSFISVNDEQGAARYLHALYQVGEGLSWTEPEVIRAWARYAAENLNWLETLGARGFELAKRGGEHPLPGGEAIDIYRRDGGGQGLMSLLQQQVEARRIEVSYSTPAVALITRSGAVKGVEAVRMGARGGRCRYRARRGVVLATGGFEFDEWMKLHYLKAYPTHFLGSPANTGDGIRMATAVGAQLWHMNCCSARLVIKLPEIPVALNPVFGGAQWHSPWRMAVAGRGTRGGNTGGGVADPACCGYIVVDRNGRRYTNEVFKPHSLYYELTGFDSQRLCYPRIPSFWIFDGRRFGDGPLVRTGSGAAGPAGFYRWSSDNGEERDRGWIQAGDTVRELAGRIGIDPAILADTVKQYNKACREGRDVDHGRSPATLAPLERPPYCAVPLWPGGPNTQGGPRRNGRAQVIRADGTAIPGLFSAGELGSIYGMLYPAGGGNIAECIAFGRIAGEQAGDHSPS